MIKFDLHIHSFASRYKESEGIVDASTMDVPVLKFFTELFCDITERLNRLSESQSDDEDEEEYEEQTEKNSFAYSSEDDEELPF